MQKHSIKTDPAKKSLPDYPTIGREDMVNKMNNSKQIIELCGIYGSVRKVAKELNISRNTKKISSTRSIGHKRNR